MQRQRLQAFSTGRFETGEDPRDFENIGRIIALPKGVPLHIRAEGGMTESVRVSFTPAVLARITGRREFISAEDAALCLNIKSSRIAQLLARLAAEVEGPGLFGNALIDATGTALVIELVRYLANQRRPGGFRRGGLKQRVHRQIVEYIHARDGAVNLLDLMQLTGISERHLTRAFKQTTGQTISGYIGGVRLKKAIELLSGTNFLVKDIAGMLGFRRAGAFCVAFARETGESPGEFKKRAAAQARAPRAAPPPFARVRKRQATAASERAARLPRSLNASARE
jgi:AraC family transcriptional regulator